MKRGILGEKAKQFRANAARCDTKAEQTANTEAKQEFREAAENWRKLAEEAESRGL
jgi:hypothetical protein